MVFSSLTFLYYFLPIALAGYYICPKKAKNYWLLAVSLVFYSWGAHNFVFVMIASIVINYLFAVFIDRSKNEILRKILLTVTVAANVSILFYNKYMNFTTGILHNVLSENIKVTSIVLPIGISFFTFQAMSYVIDVYRKNVPVQKNPFYLGLYISFFPQLVAGPIVRYQTIAEQIESRKTTLTQFCQGVTRFLIGFAQKMLLSNTMSIIADEAFNACHGEAQNMSVLTAWLGALAYSLQILFDFSGYSSMAIGLGKMFGFEFMENFNYPYIASSITDFWRRWHISLSQWFRDYVYIPLGGSRVDKNWKLYRNLFVVWALTGIWHGANFTFLFWGLGYFVLLCFEKATKINSKLNSTASKLIYRVFTLICVMLGWVVFRADSLRDAVHYYKAMFGLYHNSFSDIIAVRNFTNYKFIFLIAIICCTPVFKRFQEFVDRKTGYGWVVNFVYSLVLVLLAIIGVSSLIMGNNNPFIYFNF